MSLGASGRDGGLALEVAETDMASREKTTDTTARTLDFMLGPVGTAMGANCLNREGSPRPVSLDFSREN